MYSVNNTGLFSTKLLDVPFSGHVTLIMLPLQVLEALKGYSKL